MRLRTKFKLASVLTLVVLAGITVWRGCKRIAPFTGSVPAPVLKPNEVERITVDPHTHTIEVTTAKGTTKRYLPDRSSTISLSKSGKISLTSPQFGMELRPFAGIAGSDALRFETGIDLLYFKRLDLGGGIQTKFNLQDPRVFLHCTYNVWSNIRVGLTIDHKKTVGADLTIRF